jgi:hypothetical protein
MWFALALRALTCARPGRARWFALVLLGVSLPAADARTQATDNASAVLAGPRLALRWERDRLERASVAASGDALGWERDRLDRASVAASGDALASLAAPRERTPLRPEGRTEPHRPAPWYAPVLSAALPGAGQGLLRQQRGIVYAAAEIYFAIRAIEASRDARAERDAYRDLARSVARAPFGGERPVADWAYYERLQHFLESGAFNRTPGGGFTPESDQTTYNGAIWRLARETFWRDPDVAPEPTSAEFQRAVAFYESRAATDDFRWSWRDAQLQQDVYRQTIDRANDASRRARQMVGLILANHALSLVDAYVNVRLRVYANGAGATEQFGVLGAVPLPTLSRSRRPD